MTMLCGNSHKEPIDNMPSLEWLAEELTDPEQVRNMMKQAEESKDDGDKIQADLADDEK